MKDNTMISKSEQSVKIIPRLAEIVRSLESGTTPDWLKALRTQGISRFTQLGIPTVKDEEWKYTNLAGLAGLKFDVATDSHVIELDALKAYRGTDGISLVFINGSYSPELSNTSRLPGGLTITTLQDAIAADEQNIKKLMTKYSVRDEAVFVALNEAISGTGAYIKAREKTVFAGLIHILHVTSSRNKNIMTMPRTLIDLGPSSELTVLESHVAFNDDVTYFANALTDIFLAENATLHYCKAQKESLQAYHIGHTRVWQERNANLQGFSLTVGGKLTRNDLDCVLSGEGGNATINSLYSVHDNQHVDNHTSVDHRVPNCTSNQLYKGILNHAARAVFNGKIFVRPPAQQTNSYQLNKNLLLGEDCRVDTKPQLEIFADDVKCTHGATIGQLDQNELFYLQTRCIPRKTATKMLVHGFADDILSTIANEAIRRTCHDLLQPSLEVL